MKNFDVPSFVRIRRLNWICLFNRTGSNRKVSQVFNNNPQESRLRGRPKNRWWNCIHTQILINAKLQIGERGQKHRAAWERSVKGGKNALGCRTIEEEEEEEGGGGVA